LVALVVSLVATTTPSLAQQGGDQLRAKELFDAALELMDRGTHTTACPMLEESLTLDPGMGTKYYLARCYEKTGRIASAYELLVEVADEAEQAGRADREQHARKQAELLKRKLPRLTVVVPAELAASPTFVVTRDGKELARDRWGKAVPIDLGEHEVVARQQGSRMAWRRKVWITRHKQRAQVEIPVLDSLLSEQQGSAARPAVGDTRPHPVGPVEPGDAAEPAADGFDELFWGGIGSLVLAAVSVALYNWAFFEVDSIASDEGFQRYRESFTSDEDACEMAEAGRQPAAVGALPADQVVELCDSAAPMEVVQGIFLPASIVFGAIGVVLIAVSDTVKSSDEPAEEQDALDVDVGLHWTERATMLQVRGRF
jgi:hypothetical protein